MSGKKSFLKIDLKPPACGFLFRKMGLILCVRKSSFFSVRGVMGCGRKCFTLVWRCHQLLSGFLAKGHLLQVSRQSANDKGDNEMILGTVHRCPGICLTGEENLSSETVCEGCATVIASNGVLPSLGSHSTSEMGEKEGPDS